MRWACFFMSFLCVCLTGASLNGETAHVRDHWWVPFVLTVFFGISAIALSLRSGASS